MGNYDVAISLDQATLNRAITAVFQRQSLKSKLFSGSEAITFMGVQVKVGWEVQQVPTLSLVPPSAQQWKDAIKQDGETPQPVQNAFVVNIPQLKVSKEDLLGKIEEATTSVEAICTISISAINNRLSLDPVAAVVDLTHASPLDQFIYRTLLIPRVLHMADTMLSDEQFPDIDFKGVRFGPAVLIVGNGRIVVIANLLSRPAPVPVPAESFPNAPLYVLLSRDAIQQIALLGTQALQGKRVDTSGSRGFGVGTANYTAGIQLSNVSTSLTNDLTVANASLNMSVSASAGVNVIEVISHTAESTATTVGDGVVSAATTVGDGVVSVGQKIADAFSSY